MVTALRGITWSHPRGYLPLDALAEAAARPGPLRVEAAPIEWDRHSLDRFESHSIADLAARYDLIVLDHPTLGEATVEGALLPLDDLLTEPGWDQRFVGGAAVSYRYAGRQWAVPIDAATQVGAYQGTAGASTWQEVLDRFDVTWALPTKTPHTIMVLMGIAAAIDPSLRPTPDELLPATIAEQALQVLSTCLHRMTPETLNRDPIELLDAMVAGRLAASPFIYGYVPYSWPTAGPSPVTFTDAPVWAGQGRPGSVLGGTGIAISARCSDVEGALAHILQISGENGQQLARLAGGQPAAASLWRPSPGDAAWRDFYTGTLRTQEAAWVRPRYAGWIEFQHEASALVLAAALDGSSLRAAVGTLNGRHQAAVARAGDPEL